jgi:hypothetical protein
MQKNVAKTEWIHDSRQQCKPREVLCGKTLSADPL